jgi:hypothetical protein
MENDPNKDKLKEDPIKGKMPTIEEVEHVANILSYKVLSAKEIKENIMWLFK